MTSPVDNLEYPGMTVEQENDFLGLLDCLLDPLFMVSAEDGVIIYCNTAALQWQGCNRSDLIGQPFVMLLAESETLSREDLIAQIRIRGHVFAEQTFLLRNGLTVRADLSASVHRWAGQDRIAVHLRDAEQRIAAQRMELQLREAEARQRTVAELNHEINNPLQALLMRPGTDSDETAKGHIERIATILRTLQNTRVGGDPVKRAADAGHSEQPLKCADAGRILVADDFDTIREMLGLMLRRKLPGVQVDLAADGEQAVALFKKWHPAVIVLDFMMPKKTGEVVFAEIKAFCGEQNWEQPRIVFCTGYALPTALEAEVEAVGSHHLCLFKPVEPAKLVNTIISLVALSKEEVGN